MCFGTLQGLFKSVYVSPHLCVSYHIRASIAGEKPYVHVIALLFLYLLVNVIPDV